MHPRDNGHQAETGKSIRHDVRFYFVLIFPVIFFFLGYYLGRDSDHPLIEVPSALPLPQNQNDILPVYEDSELSQENEILFNQAAYGQKLYDRLDWAQKAIDALPLSFVLDRAAAYTGITVDSMENMDSPRDFVSRLVDVAASGTLLNLDQDESLLGGILFHGVYGKSYASTSFPINENVIYATFSLADYQDDKVLVKWYRLSDRKIMLYQQYSISNVIENFVWIRSFDGFTPGHYRVEVYGLDEELPLLVSGDYEVGYFDQGL